jgi:drug/metabolite transporter (DMT)-like permease
MAPAGWIGAVLTSVFWALSAICAQRAARAVGSLRANAVRLLLAVFVLGAATFLLQPDSFSAVPSALLLLSGVVGFGIGDVALYLALARLGSRLTVLVTFCLSPLLAATAEWLWLGETLTPGQRLVGLLLLGAVALTVRPSSPGTERYGSFAFGLAMACASAAGQGTGAVLTRLANRAAADAGHVIPALSQAFHRVAGGTTCAALVMLLMLAAGRRPAPPPDAHRYRHGWWWVLGTAACGPLIGVCFYQWALQHAPGALVLAIVSLTPVFVLPLAWWLERDRPGPLQITGAILATVLLLLLPSR